ncbi:hypothetical protein C8035_v002173 [Colletotrichum spinosum]|uniref:NAD(P)-binding domain-containing protein n=1 Tax=Colletotrichum spinosum TaxID=1347390 RepID=A0A4R8QL93_9PEZI|nr:hypothetical protein C8035_v002173 [Colletotrichum spinosum]
MRIAVAGGFAALLTHHISQTAHAVLVLSRKPRTEFEQRFECQAAVVDYDDEENLRFALQGVDLVISTIRGEEQIALIKAARSARVRLFVPAEFSGCLYQRPESSDHPLNYGSSEAMELKEHYASSKTRRMDYTVFSCGILYERFALGSLSEYGMGARECIGDQGSYLVDVGNVTADIDETNGSGRRVQVSMMSVNDVAQFVAAAIDVGPGSWPREFKLRGDRMSVLDIYEQRQNWTQWWNVQRLMATVDGRCDFQQANLNAAVDLEPESFVDWLARSWTE